MGIGHLSFLFTILDSYFLPFLKTFSFLTISLLFDSFYQFFSSVYSLLFSLSHSFTVLISFFHSFFFFHLFFHFLFFLPSSFLPHFLFSSCQHKKFSGTVGPMVRYIFHPCSTTNTNCIVTSKLKYYSIINLELLFPSA